MKKKVIIISILLVFYLIQGFSAQCGDVNEDKSVNIVDALLIAKYYVASDSININKTLADVNEDKSINIVDALLIAQLYVGVIDKLSCKDSGGGSRPPQPKNLPKHWHESGGFGTQTKGGIAGKVYKVTNLKNSGPGSFRDAISGNNRLIVFEVGGVIDLDNKELRIGGNNITVAGQTAPYPGINLIRGTFLATGNDIVVSHITTQFGDDTADWDDAANLKGNNNVFDHVAVYWARDETLTIQSVKNVTVYKSIVAEGLRFANHEDGEHSKGSLINKGFQKLSLISNLYANNALRNPRVKRNEIFLGNHIVYNWAPGWDHEGPKWSKDKPIPTEGAFNLVVSIRLGCNLAMVGSVALQGPNSVAEHFVAGHYGRPDSGNAYLNDNIIIDQEGKALSQVDTKTINVIEKPPLWPEGYKPLPADQAVYEVLRTVGPRPGDRNIHNKRIVRTMADNTGRIIDSQNDVGGYPTYAETRHSITVPSGAKARQDWLDKLEDEMAVDTELDLSRLYKLIGSEESDIYRP